MEQKAMKKLKKVAEILMMPLIITILIIMIIFFIISAIGGYYSITIDDGIWEDGENSPSSYRKNINLTRDGIEANTSAIVEEALRNAGLTDAQIQQIRKELENKGYTGEELERQFVLRALEELGIDAFTDGSDINVAQLIWELNSALYSKYLDDYEQLEYLMNAELVTKMPHLNLTKGLDGTIYFDRYTSGSGIPTRLAYIQEEEFDDLITDNDSSVLNYFTITNDNKVKIAYYYEERGSIETNDYGVNLSDYDNRFTSGTPTFSNSGYITKDISYNTIIPERYSISFEYLWALLVMSEDYDFVSGLADLAYNSEIIISIYDNIVENTVITEYTYSKQQIDYEQVKYLETETSESLDETQLNAYTESGYILESSNITATTTTTKNVTRKAQDVGIDYDEKDYYVKITMYTYTNSMEIKLTYADVWIVKYTTAYTYSKDGTKYAKGAVPDSHTDTTQGKETEEEIAGSRSTGQLIRISEPWHETNRTSVNRAFSPPTGVGPILRSIDMVTTEETREKGDKWSVIRHSPTTVIEDSYLYTSKYTNDPNATNLKEKSNINGEFDDSGNKIGENFCSLLYNSPKNSYIYNNMNWLIEMLENNQETVGLLDLITYLIGITQNPNNTDLNFDFGVFTPSSFSSFSNGNILTEYLNAWENSAVRNYINGSSSYTDYVSKYVTEDKQYYICYTDLHGTRNYGFGVCHWTGSSWNHISRYSNIGINIQDSSYNTIGVSKLEINIVDQVRDAIINDDKESIISELERNGISLTTNQIDALVAVKYQYGNIGNFVYAYTNYRDSIRKHFIVNGCKPFLTGYAGGVDRATANWKVYNEGIYTDRSGNEILVVGGGNFLNVAAETWTAVCNGSYTYGGASRIPVTGSTIDCSSYVSWVLYNYGYTEFGGSQTTSQAFYNTNWTLRYPGWQEIHISSRENPIAILQPGDIFVRYGEGTHHVLIVAHISGNHLIAYDCGNRENWTTRASAVGWRTYRSILFLN